MKEYSYNKKMMGTDVSLSFIVPTEALARSMAEVAFSTISDYEAKFSRFLPTSELSQLNVAKSANVSKDFFSVLLRSFELYKITQGAFNPLLQISRLGYDRDYKTLVGGIIPNDNNTYNIDFTTVVMNPATRRVILQDNQQLDFGGILKGYLATKLAQQLQADYPACTGLIINIGGDLHTIGLDEESKPFVFYLYNPITKQETSLPITNMSLTTSGSYKRIWKEGLDLRHHILASDGIHNPDTDIVSASIIHPDGATAEAYATLFIVRDLATVKTIIDTNNCKYFLTKTDGTTLTNIS
ncbi:MAG: hypothetical protein RLZZ230_293 [Candidatus Parcubacteria bacterium]|jgi:thiamine biosynthesis lipoprotein